VNRDVIRPSRRQQITSHAVRARHDRRADRRAVEVAHWTQDGEIGQATGAREKQWLISPSNPNTTVLRPEHKYLFKFSVDWAPEQFWTEILAHRLGLYLGISVPPTHVGVNSLTGQVGALSEFFGPRSSQEGKIVSGRNLIFSGQRFDRRRRHEYNFKAVSDWCSFFERNRFMQYDWREFWAKAFLLDTLIGNQDRHADNWGAIRTQSHSGREAFQFAPLYDHGSSMGYELLPNRFPEFADNIRLAQYVNRGTHQMFWRPEDARRLNHADFLKRFYDEFPSQRAGIDARLKISDRTLERVVAELSQFRRPIALSPQRAEFMLRLLKFRRDHLRKCLAGKEHSPRTVRSPGRPH